MELDTLPIFPPSVVGLDLETTGLDWSIDTITLVSISDGKNTWILTKDFERIIPLLEDESCTKIIHKAVFDLPMLMYKFPCKPKNIWDTLLVERIIHNGFKMDHKLDDVLARRGIALLDKSVQEKFIGYTGLVTDEMIEYAKNDVIYLPTLREKQLEDVNQMGLGRIVALENKVILPVVDMILTGLGFDFDLWKSIREEILTKISEIKDQIYADLGLDFYIDEEIKKIRSKNKVKYTEITPYQKPVCDINFDSVPQLKKVLAKLKLPHETTRAEVLEAHVDDHPFVQSLLSYKFWSKMESWDWESDINPVTGRIHPGWNQTGPGTGRMSCNNPNAQQIPKDEKPKMRALFRALPGHVFIDADYAQQEPRLLAGVSGDPKLIQATMQKDIYCAVGKNVWNKEITKADPERNLIKIGLLAVFYGAYPKGLSKKMKVSLQKAEAFRNDILAAFPIAKKWGDSQIKHVVQYGYTKTLWGRRLYYPKVKGLPTNQMWTVEKEARNMPIQGSGADVTKLALVKIYDIINSNNFDAHLILQIHDEIAVSVREDQAEKLFPLMIKAMEDAGNEVCPNVKFVAEGKISQNWEH